MTDSLSGKEVREYILAALFSRTFKKNYIHMRNIMLALWRILSLLLAVFATLVSLMSIMEWSENPYRFGYLILGVGCLFMAFYLTKD